ncbi:MAG: threonine ammonia-lyase [Acidimicrobiia bacterium]|nr:threonine ammonia-lyase [Acidimicrobiia bacterium]
MVRGTYCGVETGPPTPDVCLEVGDAIPAAREAIEPYLRHTPLESFEGLDVWAGAEVLLKGENRQRTGSFKVRGALNRLRTVPAGTTVVAASAGNHAQGVAFAAAVHGVRARVWMPEDAALPKIEATRGYGAEIVLHGGDVDSCIVEAKAEADAAGWVYVAPFDDPMVVAGQGTIGLELAGQLPTGIRTVLVPVGGGGLVSGIAIALARERPEIEVVGVEAEGAAAMAASLRAGRVVALPRAATIADGLALKSPSQLTFDMVRTCGVRVVTVNDDAIARSVLALLERAKTVVEPAGAVGVAAVAEGLVPDENPVAVVLSGGNVDPQILTKLIDHGLAAAGRHLRLHCVLPDRPGALAGLTGAIADMGLNVLTVDHHRAAPGVPVDHVEVAVHVETRNPTHSVEVISELEARGFYVETDS